jgi:hypothetical protein
MLLGFRSAAGLLAIVGLALMALAAAPGRADARFDAPPAATNQPLHVERTATFETICDRNHYLTSPSGGLVAAFRSDLVGGRGPFLGPPDEAAFAPIDCLTGETCAGWIRVVADQPITGVSLDDHAMTIRVHGVGLFRIDLDGTVRQLASISEDPCRSTDLYVGGCARRLVNAGAPPWAFDPGREAPQRRTFGYAGEAGETACDEAEICLQWPTPEKVGLVPRASGGLVALADGRLLLSPAERETACKDLGPDCLIGEFAPLLDARTGAYVAPLSADALAARSGDHADLITFAFRLPGSDLTLLGVGDDRASRRIVLRSPSGDRVRACPVRPITLPPFLAGAKIYAPAQAEGRVRRVSIGPASHSLTLFVDRPARPGQGTVVNFAGGPMAAVDLGRDAIEVTAVNAGAVVVRPVISGQDGLTDGAWRRLRSGGKAALEADVEALETELADQVRYPRPLILTGNSFGALPLRLMLERGRLAVDGVILGVPMTAYRSPEDLVETMKRMSGGDLPEAVRPQMAAAIRRNRLFVDRAFGEGVGAGQPFRQWIDAFDACLLPPGSRVYLASNDTKVSWTPPTRCAGPTVTTLPGDHDLALNGSGFSKLMEQVLPAMLHGKPSPDIGR